MDGAGTGGATLKYDAVVDLADRNNSHTLLHELAVECTHGPLSILEVGCSSGYLGATLVARGHRVTGVEPDAASVEAAARVLSDTWHGDLGTFLAAHRDARFDVLVFGDVLEHMADPADALREAARHLRMDGRVVMSLPNVAHAAIRAMLLQGRFDYASHGILDATHLRFFSHEGVARLCADCGLAIDRIHAVCLTADAVGTRYGMRLSRKLITAVELLDEGPAPRDAFQYVLRATRSTQPHSALLEINLAVPIERATPPRSTRTRDSLKQRVQVALLQALLTSISAQRFRSR